MPIQAFKSTAYPSPKGFKSLALEEGTRTKAYLDSKGIPTIGIGHTLMAPSGIRFTMASVWTPEYCIEVFERDSASFIQAANDDLCVAVNQHQFDALYSLEYNIGITGLRKSHIIDVINSHGPGEVRMEDFLAWAHPTELKGRRMREWEMYSKGVYRAA